MNAKSSADPMSVRFLKPFYKYLLRDKFYEDDLHLIAWINYDDNPWHSELELERAFDKKNSSKAAYEHKWHGHYNDSILNALISTDEFDACIDAHIKLGFKAEGAIIASYDPSDEGDDDKGFAIRHGSVITHVEANPDGDVNEGTDWAIAKAIEAGADWFTWDCDGMGIALKRQVSRALGGKHIQWEMFRGSESPENPDQEYIDTGESSSKRRKTNKETFANKRAQFAVRLADRCKATYRAIKSGDYVDPDEMISFSSEIDCMDQLRAEVCRIPLKPNQNGKIQLMSKEEMARKPYQLPSPNLFDACAQSTMIPKSLDNKPININFQGWG